MCDTAVRFESPASHMCDIIHICVQVDYQLFICLAIVVDYPYYQLFITKLATNIQPIRPLFCYSAEYWI